MLKELVLPLAEMRLSFKNMKQQCNRDNIYHYVLFHVYVS